jgi:hypothetical protein
MNSKTALRDQNTRLAAAYWRMAEDGREALDRLVGQLADTHRDLVKGFPPALRDTGGNREKFVCRYMVKEKRI